MQGPESFGEPPRPRKNVKGDTKAFNEYILKEGPRAAVEAGLLRLDQYQKTCQSLNLYRQHAHCPASLGVLCNVWLWGEPGVGKSRRARTAYGDSLFIKPLNKWWDGYAGEAVVILDDVDLDCKWLAHFLKIWADHYPFNAECKGSTMSIRPQRIVVTSNHHPRELWSESTQLYKAVARRFSIERMEQLKPHEPASHKKPRLFLQAQNLKRPPFKPLPALKLEKRASQLGFTPSPAKTEKVSTPNKRQIKSAEKSKGVRPFSLE